MRRAFLEIDVFADEPFLGNPLAVVVDAEGLDTEDMERITRWENFSETAFLLPPTVPDADYRVRIFTLRGELPFAGHPTLGSCRAWLESGGLPAGSDVVVQECGAGLVPVRRDGDLLAFAAPPLVRRGPVDSDFASTVLSVLGVSPAEVMALEWVDNGPGWVGVLFPDATSVLALEPDFSRFRGEGSLDIGVVGPRPAGESTAFEVRAFFSGERGAMMEDPVTGSLNASLAQWLLAAGHATAPYVAAQGTRLGRTGRVHIDGDPTGTVWVGGAAHVLVSGHIEA